MAANGRWRRALAYPALFAGLALIYLGPLTLCPTCLSGGAWSDLMISHLPNAVYWRDTLARYGQWPWWNAQLFAGQPFAADPLSGVWYPPNLLLLVLPLPFAFNVLYAAHLTWAGYGLFRFLRAEGRSAAAALFGGLAFMGTPKLLAHLGAGHASLVCAVAWTPWLLLAMRAVRITGGLRAGGLAGAGLAMIFLADPRWAFYAAVLAGAFWLAALPPFQPPRPDRRGLPAAAAYAAAFLSLSAVLWLPLLVFSARSNRAALTLAEAAVYSLPPYYFIGLVIPDLGGFHEWMTYLGVAPLLLALAGLLARRRWFWGLAALTAGAFALGTNSVVFPALFRLLPGLGYLRVPPRAWFVAALAAAILAAEGLDWLIGEAWPRLRVSPALPRLRRWLPPAAPVLAGLLVFTVLDLWRVGVTVLEVQPRPARAPAAEWLAEQAAAEGLFRVYSPSLSLLPGDGLQHVDGINPLQLAAVTRFLSTASGVDSPGYSVTVPAFSIENSALDLQLTNAAALPDARLLGRLNVKYIAAEFDLAAPELRLVRTFGRTRVYANLAVRPRAWLETGAPVEVRAWSPNRLELRASGPGLLTLADAAYPGWRAWVDGGPAPVETVEEFLRGVRLPAGAHTIVFEFWPLADWAGLGLTLAGLAGLGGVLWRTRPAQ